MQQGIPLSRLVLQCAVLGAVAFVLTWVFKPSWKVAYVVVGLLLLYGVFSAIRKRL